jgi:hypothetical protein
MPDGRVKIMDFGIARLQKADATGSGAIVGTPTYMAPEQITNGAITAATDVFSVGCMLYELLCYQRPFEAESVHGVLYQVLTTEPRPLRTVAPSIPAALERVVAKAMNKVPHDTSRPPDARLLRASGPRSGRTTRRRNRSAPDAARGGVEADHARSDEVARGRAGRAGGGGDPADVRAECACPRHEERHRAARGGRGGAHDRTGGPSGRVAHCRAGVAGGDHTP